MDSFHIRVEHTAIKGKDSKPFREQMIVEATTQAEAVRKVLEIFGTDYVLSGAGLVPTSSVRAGKKHK